MPGVPELTPREFLKRWSEPLARSRVVLLDVREGAELALASLESAVHIPMGDVPARLAELDRTATHVVMCHSGYRSRLVAEYLHSNGFEDVFNLRGGIDAWSTEIDPRVPRY